MLLYIESNTAINDKGEDIAASPEFDTFSFEMPAEDIALEVAADYAEGGIMMLAASEDTPWDEATEIEANLEIQERTVSVTITNIGSRAGAEVVQLYIGGPQNGIHRPKKELKGFARVELEPGESKRVTFTLNDRSFAVWKKGWAVPEGIYEVLLAASDRDIRLRGTMEVKGQEVPAPSSQKESWYEDLHGAPCRKDWERIMGHPLLCSLFG